MIKINKDWSFRTVYPSVGAYTTTYNCIDRYPFIESIKSFSWCDNVYVADFSDDEKTTSALRKLSEEMPNLNIFEMPLSEEPGKDGISKTLSRAMVLDDYCLQFDCDEICVGSVDKWKTIVKEFPDGVEMMNMYVCEPVGDVTHLRLDGSHNIWKWRLSKNFPHIVHGIPEQDREVVGEKIYSRGQSDGCFPIHVVSNTVIDSFHHQSVEKLLTLKNRNVEEYARAVEEMINGDEPFILHVGHVDIKNKLNLYLGGWHNWWCKLYNQDPDDPGNNRYFPGVLPKDVSEEDVDKKVSEILEKTPFVACEGLRKYE